uniref:SUFU negative regulator of hedgehog signaling n=1 Tax=Anas platyrhynchos platyrhynchos TaxID=8840 RepID=U3I4G1_ANAPP
GFHADLGQCRYLLVVKAHRVLLLTALQDLSFQFSCSLIKRNCRISLLSQAPLVLAYLVSSKEWCFSVSLQFDPAPCGTCSSQFSHLCFYFFQIVGVCTEELHAAQQWNGQGILELLRTVPVAGGPWLITDMRRGETIFEIDPHLQERVDKGIETDGSNLSGVSAKCAWDDLSRPPEDDEDSRSICIGTQPRRLSGKDTEQIRETLRRGLEINSKPVLPPINAQRQNGLNHDRAPSGRSDSISSSLVFPCLLRKTFQSSCVQRHKLLSFPLQILLTEEFVERMLEDLEDLNSPEEFKLPKEYSWPEKKLKVSILPDAVFDNPLH